MANVRKSLLGIVAACVVHGGVTAQGEEEKLFNEAFRAMMLNKLDEASGKLQEIIKLNPSNERAFKLYLNTEGERWREMLASKGNIGEYAQHIMSLAKKGRVELTRDEAEIQAAVTEATTGGSGEHGKRQKAIDKIVTQYGEFAVPALLKVLGDADNEQGQLYANIALRSIGRPATLALIEATHSDNPVLRRNIASVFNFTKDHRAIPALTSMLSGGHEGVTDVATAALRNMGASPSADAVDLFLKQSQDYIVGIGTTGSEISSVVWSFKDGSVSYQDCNPAVYRFELAKRSAERALTLDPASAKATTLIARSYLAQVAAIENAGIEELNDVKSSLSMVAMAMGPKVLGSALTESLEAGQPSVAVAAIRALGQTEDKDSLAGSPLMAALSHPSKLVRYEAALAVTAASRASNVPQSEKVVGILAEAIAEQKQKQIVTVGLDQSNRTAARNASSARFGHVVEANMSNIKDATLALYGLTVRTDVVVINEVLADGIPETLLGLIEGRDTLKNIKTVIVAKDVDKATERFGDRVAGVIQAGFKPEELRTKVDEALEGVDLGENNKRAGILATSASQSLETLAKNRVDISGAISKLEEQLQRSDEVSIPAAGALGESGTDIKALVGQITGDGSTALKIACADAAGKILGRGASVEAHFEALKGIAANAEADAGLRAAVTKALGKAKLSPSQKLQLVEALKTMAVSGG